MSEHTTEKINESILFCDRMIDVVKKKECKCVEGIVTRTFKRENLCLRCQLIELLESENVESD